ncbi:MAG: hypothetical protein ABJB10_08785 [Mesorhizobium sp.]
MTRYFFDFLDTGEEFPDPEGTELADLEAAKDEAVRALADIARDVLPDGNHRELVFNVRDEEAAGPHFCDQDPGGRSQRARLFARVLVASPKTVNMHRRLTPGQASHNGLILL